MQRHARKFALILRGLIRWNCWSKVLVPLALAGFDKFFAQSLSLVFPQSQRSVAQTQILEALRLALRLRTVGTLPKLWASTSCRRVCQLHPSACALDRLKVAHKIFLHFRVLGAAFTGVAQGVAAQMAVENQTSHSGTFSGTLRPSPTPYVPFDPLAFRRWTAIARLGILRKSLFYWTFWSERVAIPAGFEPCNPRSRNPLLELVLIQLWSATINKRL